MAINWTLPSVRRRSSEEIRFRLKQELWNATASVLRPGLLRHLNRKPGPLAALPNPQRAAQSVPPDLRALVETAAAQIRAHRFPLLGLTLDTGPDVDWRRDYHHGVSSPLRYFRFVRYLDFAAVGDHKVVWELNRHQHLVLLAQAFLLTQERAYLDEIHEQLQSWLRQNPFPFGINWTSALEVAFRALSWLWLEHLVGAELDRRVRARLLKSLYRHGCFLEHNLSVYFAPNTHLLGEAVALHALGMLLPEWPRAVQWRSLGREWTHRQMETQVRPDGSHFEQSSYYHVYALDMFLFHLVLEPEAPASFRQSVQKMARYLECLMGPARRLSWFGDDDGGRFFFPYGPPEEYGRATLATAARLLRQPFAHDVHDAAVQALWWLGPQTSESAPAPLPEQQSFPDAGVTTGTRGDVHVVFKQGPMGPAAAGHSHADLLSITVHRGNEALLIDPGTFTYLSDAAQRDWFRSTQAHNTVLVDGHNQGTPENPFRWREKPHAQSVSPWEATAEYAGITHRRRLSWTEAGLLIIEDEVDAGPGEHLMEQYWHCGVPVQLRSPACFQLGSQARLHLQPGTSRAWEEGNEFGWRSRAFLTREPAPAICVSIRGEGPLRLTAVLDFEGRHDQWPLPPDENKTAAPGGAAAQLNQ
jgi:uncharacterized heparinase superfamily protein